jgi:hypothetical protein
MTRGLDALEVVVPNVDQIALSQDVKQQGALGAVFAARVSHDRPLRFILGEPVYSNRVRISFPSLVGGADDGSIWLVEVDPGSLASQF